MPQIYSGAGPVILQLQMMHYYIVLANFELQLSLVNKKAPWI